MDYEKKYNEALERFKTFREKYCTCGNLHFGDVIFDKTGEAQKDLDAIFPELRESEDERIRKIIRLALIASEDELSDFYKVHNISRKECTDWLEKQKDNKFAPRVLPCSAAWFEDGEEKQKEPIDPFDTKLFQDGVKEGRRLEREDIMKEQKPAERSEEDEYYMDAIITIINRETALYPKGGGTESFNNDLIDWLKSRRPSKDCSGCAKNLEGYISGRCDAENKLLEQFGALVTPEGELVIPPRWKPSEEQIGALNYAYCRLFKSEYVGHNILGPLQKLCDELAKL